MKTITIYKISYKDNIYIGATENIDVRWEKHRLNYKVWLDTGRLSITIFPYFKKFGIENFTFDIIKEYKVCDKSYENYSSNAWEQLWINKYKQDSRYNCVNKNYPLKMLLKKQYQQNYMKTYERDYEKERKKYNENKDVINKKRREKAKNIPIIKCECGFSCKENVMAKHIKSNKHKVNMLLIDKSDINNPTSKLKCPCGSITTKRGYPKHCRGKKHQKFLDT